MGNLTLFHYIEGNSIFHRHNPFLKLCEMIFAVSVIAFSGLWSLGLYFLLFLLALFFAGIRPLTLVRNLKMFWWLLVFIFAAPLISQEVPLFPDRFIIASRECLRFMDYILVGFLFTQTTSPDKLYGVIYSLFRPIPLVPHRKLASFFLIIFTLLPKAVDTYAEVGESLGARALGNSKNPLHRALYRVYPLMINMFLKTDNFSEALASRCFNSDADLQNRQGFVPMDLVLLFLFSSIIAVCYLVSSFI